jgi:ribosome biogenesis GTPase
MELEQLGFDDWFETKFSELKKPDRNPARMTAVDRDSYLIRNASSEIRAELSGNLLYNTETSLELPGVGDWVSVQYYDGDTFAVIHDVLPRKSLLRRKTSGRAVDYQVIAANVDTAFILQSCDANFNIHRLERYLVMAVDGRVKPVLVFTKKDLADEVDVTRISSEVRAAGIEYPVIFISSKLDEGVDVLKSIMEPGKTFCLLGSSGVGKTTLLNRLLGSDMFDTQEVREFDGKGRHTTTRRQLTLLDWGAMLVDTPGMRELGTIGMGDGIEGSFADAADLARECRFADCSHTSEEGCALLAALEDGRLSRDRYETYLSLMAESDFHEMSYAEKRKKDKDFGKYIKTVKKQLRK